MNERIGSLLMGWLAEVAEVDSARESPVAACDEEGGVLCSMADESSGMS